jgi:hypothetical protein
VLAIARGPLAERDKLSANHSPFPIAPQLESSLGCDGLLTCR